MSPKVARLPKPRPRRSRFVIIPTRTGVPHRVRPSDVVWIEGENGPRVYLAGGHSFETSHELTADAVQKLLEE